MFRKTLISALLVLAVASPAFAQKAEVSFVLGYTFSEGINFNAAVATPIGTYNRIDPAAGFSYGFTFGVYVTPQAEIEFLYGHQSSTLEITGTGPQLNGDMGINNYHGNFVYNFGDESSKARPFMFIGLGATSYGDAVFPDQSGVAGRTVPGISKFSWALGGGVKAWANKNVGVKAMFRWVPTYINSDAEGWWCDPWYGCGVVGTYKYSHQFELAGGIVARF
ncbi:MAG: outer membrane beta-barrel protein [Bacteroidales bacterium]